MRFQLRILPPRAIPRMLHRWTVPLLFIPIQPFNFLHRFAAMARVKLSPVEVEQETKEVRAAVYGDENREKIWESRGRTYDEGGDEYQSHPGNGDAKKNR